MTPLLLLLLPCPTPADRTIDVQWIERNVVVNDFDGTVRLRQYLFWAPARVVDEGSGQWRDAFGVVAWRVTDDITHVRAVPGGHRCYVEPAGVWVRGHLFETKTTYDRISDGRLPTKSMWLERLLE